MPIGNHEAKMKDQKIGQINQTKTTLNISNKNNIGMEKSKNTGTTSNNRNTNTNTNTVNVNVTHPPKESSFKKSFSEGAGNELGRRLIWLAMAGVIAIIVGFVLNSSPSKLPVSSNENKENEIKTGMHTKPLLMPLPVDKSEGNNGNAE